MKEIHGKIHGKMHQHNKSKLPRKLTVDKKHITLETEIAKKFNECFTFFSFLFKASSTLPEIYLIINELKDAFFYLKMNNSTVADEISINLS